MMKILLIINEDKLTTDSLKIISLCDTAIDVSGTNCRYIKFPPQLEFPGRFHLSELMSNIEQEIVMHECAKGE